MKNKNRRDFIKLSSIITIGSPYLLKSNLLRARGLKSSGSNFENDKVIIIGAGIAGLTTAYELEKMGITNITIIEAKDRVGGRTLNVPVEGGYVAEGGGQWIGPGQTAIFGLLEELDIGTFKSYAIGDNANGDSLSNADLQDRDRVIALLEELANEITLEEPWNAPMAEEWDSIILDDWLSDNHQTIGGYFELFFGTIAFLGNPTNISLLYFLFYVKSGGGVLSLLEGAQESRISGGSQMLSLQLASKLSAEILLSTPVISIGEVNGTIAVQTENDTLNCERVVVAMMPKDANKINFITGLTEERQQLQEGWIASAGMKISIVFTAPFWREDGLNGGAYGNQLFFIADNSPEDASSGILVAFPTEQFEIAENREAIAVEELASIFGPKIYDYIDYTETNWDLDPYTGGCVSPLPVGFFSQYGAALREPVGNIHWAGTETSEIWNGYMDGAVRSGQRVAKELVEVLNIASNVSREVVVIKIYPNPTEELLTIKAELNLNSITMLDAQGKFINVFQTIDKKTQVINVSSYPIGIYYLEVYVNGAYQRLKWVKN